jgi:hypothetical protein
MIPTLLLTALLGHPALISTSSQASTPQGAKPTTAVEPLKLTGCMSAKPGSTGDYTFTSEGGTQYRLTGKDTRKFGGKKVEITQANTKAVSIRGGLYPSPNVAGQAGALDPVRAGIATQPGGGAANGTGSDLPEFRASRVRAVEGACQ